MVCAVSLTCHSFILCARVGKTVSFVYEFAFMDR